MIDKQTAKLLLKYCATHDFCIGCPYKASCNDLVETVSDYILDKILKKLEEKLHEDK